MGKTSIVEWCRNWLGGCVAWNRRPDGLNQIKEALTWDDEGKKGGVAFQADKADYRGLLAGLEGVTGKKAVNSEALTVKN